MIAGTMTVLVSGDVGLFSSRSSNRFQLTQASRENHRQTNDLVKRIVRLIIETNALSGQLPSSMACVYVTDIFSASVAIISLILFAGVPVSLSTTFPLCFAYQKLGDELFHMPVSIVDRSVEYN